MMLMKLTDIYCVSCMTSIVLSALHVQIYFILTNTLWDLSSWYKPVIFKVKYVQNNALCTERED